MMSWIFNLGYLAAISLALPILCWRAIWQGKYRAGWREKFLGQLPARNGDADCIWLHAVSVGEVNLLPGVVTKIKQQHPELSVYITTTTKTGMEVAQKHFPHEQVAFCPLDFSWAVGRAFDRIRPSMLVLAELELWPNMIRTAERRGIPVAIMNARLSDRSFRGYQRWQRLLRPMLQGIKQVAAQDATTASRFEALGIPREHITITGSLKFDGAPTNRQSDEVRARRKLAGASVDQKIWIAGSTIEPEEERALAAYNRLRSKHEGLRLMIVPRHPERFDAVANLIQSKGLRCVRRSQLQAPRTTWDAGDVLLVDSIGELKHWWGLADIAFVGGSMGNRGGQNMLEPAGYGAAVSFGPDTRNFRDIAALLLDAGGAVRVADGPAMERFVESCLQNPDAARTCGEKARQLVLAGRGATDRTVTLLTSTLFETARAKENLRRLMAAMTPMRKAG